jgi:DNA-binding PadR family transcriptional regulator/O-acetyl-ADP-ribose deacetylase (regulator of RNase III)
MKVEDIYQFFENPPPIYLCREQAICYILYVLLQGDFHGTELIQKLATEYPNFRLSDKVLYGAINIFEKEKIIIGYNRVIKKERPRRIYQISPEWQNLAQNLAILWQWQVQVYAHKSIGELPNNKKEALNNIKGIKKLPEVIKSTNLLRNIENICLYFENIPRTYLCIELAVCYILFVLLKGESYGIELIQNLEVEYPKYRLSDTVLYGAIKFLEDERAITGYWKKLEGRGRPRRMYQVALEWQQKAKDIARLWQKYHNTEEKVNMLNELGNNYLSSGEYKRAINYYQQSLNIAREIYYRYGEIMSLNNLGKAYCEKKNGDRAENLENAMEVYSSALKVCTREDFPEQWAKTQYNLGNAYLERVQGNQVENTDNAIVAYQAALSVLTQETFPNNWATIQKKLGIAYFNRIRGDKANNIENAIAAYTAALTTLTRDDFPDNWAEMQKYLGMAYRERIQGDKANNLEVAIACYQAALEVYTRDAFPDEWAGIRENIGDTYIAKIDKDGLLNKLEATDNIEYAILYYQDALKIYTRESFSDESGIIREKLSNAHYLLEYYQGELEVASLIKANNRDEALARIELTRGNILDLEVDVLVRPTSTSLDFGGEISRQVFEILGGTDFSWYKIVREISQIPLGEVFVTEANPLLAHYLFHTPVLNHKGATVKTISQAVTAVLNKAESLIDVDTIAFPSLGTGSAGLNPAILALKVLILVTNHLEKGSHLEKVIFAFVDEAAYQAYASAYQILLLERRVNYEISIITPQEIVTVGKEVEISVNINQTEITQGKTYTLQIPQNESIGAELNIILNAPGFQFNNDNATSLPLDPDTTSITQTATFNLTAIRPGITKIKAEIYCGETYKTTLETEVEINGFEEIELPPLVAARSRPVSQPDIILQVRTTWNENFSTCTFNYHIDTYQQRLFFTDNIDYNSQSLSAAWLETTQQLLKSTLEEASNSQKEDFRSRLASLGQYLFKSFLPQELQNIIGTITSLRNRFNLLILTDQDACFPWELLHDGKKFFGEYFIIGRWLWELEKTRPYEFPVGTINVAHYANVEQPEIWTELLRLANAPEPIPFIGGVLADLNSTESMRGLHLVRFGQSLDAIDRENAPIRIDGESNVYDIEKEVQPAKLTLRRNRPLVTLSYINAGQSELTLLEKTWASTFVRAGCSAFVGSLWAVQPNVESAFSSTFYNMIWAGKFLGIAFQTARELAKAVAPDSLDWLAYVLFGDPMARPYRPVQGQGYAVVEPIGQEIDDPVSPGTSVRFRVSLRRTPPVWYENRLMTVAEDLTFEDLRVFVITSGLQVIPDDSIVMRRTATGDYLNWFTLTVPADIEARSIVVQVYFEDGMEPVHNLRFALNVIKQESEGL